MPNEVMIGMSIQAFVSALLTWAGFITLSPLQQFFAGILMLGSAFIFGGKK